MNPPFNPKERRAQGDLAPDQRVGDPNVSEWVGRYLGQKATGSEETAAAPPPRIPEHELIRRVGHGAYGDVWLARTVLGTFRAVKVVYQERFGDRRPFDREYAGIQRYEPLSHAHHGLVDILQIGRSEAEDCFYYVMELADDAGRLTEQPVAPNQPSRPNRRDRSARAASSTIRAAPQPPINPDTYTSLTLAAARRRLNRLPFHRCLELGLVLADSLGFLHEHGLVHRDVKPSNIIFVGGAPKLADIGLIAGANESRSLVGTEGFVAPEGPNSPTGDIFSLGKVLYEISMGKDRYDFPDPPEDLGASPDAEALLELNAVIVKACEPDPRRRYQSMASLQEDLWHLQAGKSVRRRHCVRQTATTVAKTVLAAMLLGLLIAVTSLIHRFGKPAPRSRPDLEEFTLRPIEFGLNPHQARRFDFSPQGRRVVFDQDGRLFLWDKGKGTTAEVGTGSDQGGWRLGGPRWSPVTTNLVACAGTRRSGGSGPKVNAQWTILLVNLQTDVVNELGQAFGDSIKDLCWQTDGKSITYAAGDAELKVVRLEVLSLERTQLLQTDGNRGLRFGGYSPDGRWLVFALADLTGQRDVWIVPAGGGSAHPITRHPAQDRHPTWGPRGRTVFFVSNRIMGAPTAFSLWRQGIDPESGQPEGAPEPVRSFDGDYELMFPQALTAPPRLGFARRLPIQAIWIAPDDQPDRGQLAVHGRAHRLSPNGQTLFYLAADSQGNGLYSFHPTRDATPLRVLSEPIQIEAFEISPKGDTLAFFGRNRHGPGLFILPSHGGSCLRLRPFEVRHPGSPQWSPDGQWLAYVENRWLCKIRRDGTQPRRLARLHDWEASTVRWSPDGNALACLGHESEEHRKNSSNAVFLIPGSGGEAERLTPREESAYKEGLEWHPGGQFLTYFIYGGIGPGGTRDRIRKVALDHSAETLVDRPDLGIYRGFWAPDGHRFYFWTFKGGPHVYRLASGEIEPVACGPNASLPRWSRDGKTMAWSLEQSEYSLWCLGLPNS